MTTVKFSKINSEEKQVSSKNGMSRNVLINFAILGSAIFVIFCVSLIVTVIETNNNIIQESKSTFTLQIDRQASTTLQEASRYFLQKLTTYDEAVVGIIAETTSNSLRHDYVMNLSLPNYMDLEPKKPLTSDARNDEVSLSASTYFVTDSSSDTIFDNELISLRNRTNTFDVFFENAYSNYADLIIVYEGFPTNKSLFRQYPGAEMRDSSRSYDATARPWYNDAVAEGNTIFTSPYPDKFGKGWIITCARVIANPFAPVDNYVNSNYSDEVRGVVGADLTIATLNAILGNITFLETGKLTLFEESGQVVSDPEWDASAANENEFTFHDLMHPPVSQELWNIIYATPTNNADMTGVITKIKSNGYFIYVNHMQQYGAKYYIVAFVLEEEITAPMQSSMDDLEKANVEVVLILLVFTFIVFAVMMGLMMLLIRSVLSAMNLMECNIDQLLKNVGNKERALSDGMVDVYPSHTSELDNMRINMNIMIENLRNTRNGKNGYVGIDKDMGQSLLRLVPFNTIAVPVIAPQMIIPFEDGKKISTDVSVPHPV